MLLFFCIDIFTDCHLDLIVYVCLFHCLKNDSHLVETGDVCVLNILLGLKLHTHKK